jgi:long-chain acyl-CoA synthetase
MNRESLLRAFDRLAGRFPHRPLVVAPGRRARVADVDALARAAAGVLEQGAPADGWRRGEPVALQAANGPGFLAAFLALRRAGLAVLMVDPRTPPLERRRLAGEMGARRSFVSPCAWPAGAGAFQVEAVAGRGDPAAAVDPPAGTAVIKLSSGSTGSARGIAASLESLLADDAALRSSMGIGDGDRLLTTVPLSHSYGLSSLLIPSLVHGLPLVLPAGDGPFAPLTAAVEGGATVFPTVPAYLGALTRVAEPPPLPPSLRLVLSAGAPLPAETSALFRQRFGRPVHVFYGASECGGICYDRTGGAAERGTVGSPVDGVGVELAPLEDGAGGERARGGGRVVVRSPATALGYLPGEGRRLGDGRYVSDDLAEWRGGELSLVGRLNDLINVKGKKVNPREVENVLAALPAVEDVLVSGGRSPRGGSLVRAVVACRPGSLSSADVVAHCRRHLADHKVPRNVVLVDALPRNDRGKVDRAAVDRLLAERGACAGATTATP